MMKKEGEEEVFSSKRGFYPTLMGKYVGAKIGTWRGQYLETT
jgi:hypothetical protein